MKSQDREEPRLRQQANREPKQTEEQGQILSSKEEEQGSKDQGAQAQNQGDLKVHTAGQQKLQQLEAEQKLTSQRLR